MLKPDLRIARFDSNDIVTASSAVPSVPYLTLANFGDGYDDNGTISFNGGTPVVLSTYNSNNFRTILNTNLGCSYTPASFPKCYIYAYGDSSKSTTLKMLTALDKEDLAEESIYNGIYVYDSSTNSIVRYNQ